MSRCISMSLTGLPRMRALPAVGKISRISSLMVVDFPAPFGPMNPKISPSSTCMFNPSSEVLFFRFRNPCGYSLVRFSVSMAGAVMNTFLAAAAGRSIPIKMECAWSENRQEKCERLESGVTACCFDLHKFGRGRGLRHRHRLQLLRGSPIVQHAYLLHAGNRAARRAELFRIKLPVPHLGRVLRQWDSRIATLL